MPTLVTMTRFVHKNRATINKVDLNCGNLMFVGTEILARLVSFRTSRAGKDVPWDGLTCDRLLNMAGAVQTALRKGRSRGKGKSKWRGRGGTGLAYEKLTHGYWRKFIREAVLTAAGEKDLTQSCTVLTC